MTTTLRERLAPRDAVLPRVLLFIAVSALVRIAFSTGGVAYLDLSPGSVGLSVTVNTGKTAFTGTIPTGFSAWAP